MVIIVSVDPLLLTGELDLLIKLVGDGSAVVDGIIYGLVEFSSIAVRVGVGGLIVTANA